MRVKAETETKGLTNEGQADNALWKFLLGITILFIVYGTLIPFDFHSSRASLLRNWDAWWSLYPEIGQIDFSLPDLVQNVILFLPFGFTAFMVFHSRQGSFFLVAVLTTTAGVFLSLTVESLQLLTSDRTSSFLDCLTNGLGTLLGALGGYAWIRLGFFIPRLEILWKVRQNPMGYPFLVCLILLGLQTWQPFDFSLDWGSVKGNIKYLFSLSYGGFLNELAGETLSFLYYSLIVFLSIYLVRNSRRGELGLNVSPKVQVQVLLVCVLLGCVLEASQIVVQSRGPTVGDLLVIFLGAAGGMLAASLPRPLSGWLKTFPVTGLFLFTFSLAALRDLSPFQFSAIPGGVHSEMNWIPFYAHYLRTNALAWADFFEGMLLFIPLGFFAYRNAPKNHLITRFGGVVGLSVVLAWMLEYIQGFIPGRFPDISDVLACAFGLIAGAILAGQERKTVGPLFMVKAEG